MQGHMKWYIFLYFIWEWYLLSHKLGYLSRRLIHSSNLISIVSNSNAKLTEWWWVVATHAYKCKQWLTIALFYQPPSHLLRATCHDVLLQTLMTFSENHTIDWRMACCWYRSLFIVCCKILVLQYSRSWLTICPRILSPLLRQNQEYLRFLHQAYAPWNITALHNSTVCNHYYLSCSSSKSYRLNSKIRHVS